MDCLDTFSLPNSLPHQGVQVFFGGELPEEFAVTACEKTICVSSWSKEAPHTQ